jgi:hypothetical protein
VNLDYERIVLKWERPAVGGDCFRVAGLSCNRIRDAATRVWNASVDIFAVGPVVAYPFFIAGLGNFRARGRVFLLED